MKLRYIFTSRYYFRFFNLLFFLFKNALFHPNSIEKKYFEKFLSGFTRLTPSEKNSFDLFNGSWSTAVSGIQSTGSFDGFNDERIKWLLDELGGMKGKKVLELGPLEGAHTYMLEKAGGDVLSIEGNHGAYIRCLIVKNFYGLKSKFLLGDFSDSELTTEHFDTVVASGILYHMEDPIALLKKIASKTDNLFIWTHYFEENLEKWSIKAKKQIKNGKWEIDNPKTHDFDGLSVKTIRQDYGDAKKWSGFCGGRSLFSYWIYKEDLLALLRKLGFANIRINFDKVDHPNGPCFALIASKFDVEYYLDAKINPDLYNVFADLPSEERELRAIEHFNVYGRKEGRLPIQPKNLRKTKIN